MFFHTYTFYNCNDVNQIDDCVQLCECDWTLLNNGVCDPDCNNTGCEWDLYDCTNGVDANATCYQNETNPNATCYLSWASDQWCDDNCAHFVSCSYDNNACDACTGDCAQAFTILINYVASIYEPTELITVDEVCLRWGEINRITDFADEYDNCTILFNDWDENGNGYVGLREAIEKALARSNALQFHDNWNWQLKLTQINCSSCLNDASLYDL